MATTAPAWKQASVDLMRDALTSRSDWRIGRPPRLRLVCASSADSERLARLTSTLT
jgi:hypothetical protein